MLLMHYTRNHHYGVSPVPTVSSRRRRQRQRCYVNRPLFIFLLYTLLLLILQATSISGQVEEYCQSDLEIMTEIELEDLCIKRGFQLVNDDINPETGEVYTLTKQDYIEAAQRCLAIEKEMNELLTQYPELADELDEEMKRLEGENAEKQAKVEELENQIESNSVGKTVDSGDSSSHSSNNDGKKAVNDTSNMAFSRGKNVNNNDKIEDEDDDIVMSVEVSINESIDDDCPSVEESTPISATTIIDDADLQESSSSTTSYNNPDTRDNIMEEDSNIETHTVTQDDDDNNDTIGTDMKSLKDDTSSATTDDSGDDKEDFTLTHLAIESLRVLVKNAKDDVKRAIELVIPVMQPLLNAGDVAWKQIKSLFEKARKTYEAYQATNQSSSSSPSNKEMEESAVSETCDDPISNST